MCSGGGSGSRDSSGAAAAAVVDAKAVPLGFLFCCLAEAHVRVAGSGVAFFFLGLLVAIVEHGGWRLIMDGG